MKRIIVSVLSMLAVAVVASAIPARPGKVTHKGENGQAVQVTLHGDEFCHWATDESGREVTISRDGIVRPVPETRGGVRKYSPSWRRIYTPTVSPLTKGNNHFLVILVEFADQSFVLDNPKERFTRQLNDDAYSDFGGTGSVHKYYYEQSSGAFDPIFDVIGPVKISGNVADYGGNDENNDDKNAPGAFVAAVEAAHNQGLVNFADYDCNGDGYVDNIFFYYAGHNEAEQGGADTIWPHAYGFYGSNSRRYDGVLLGRYACTSELRGNSGSTMCGIGTFCHEFGHVLGLPDFYDTDYEENGSAAALYYFSLMCSGSYNNNGCTPPNLNAIERNMLGWMDFPEEWTEGGSKTIRSITNNEAFRIASTNPGEFFLLEVRDGTGWDSKIAGKPAGLLIYHVDQSTNMVDGVSAITRWVYGSGINAIGSHPCFFVVPASTESKYASYVFPGSTGKTSFGMDTSPSNKDYLNGYNGFNLNNISYSGGTVTLDLEMVTTLTISGTVTDSAGNPLEGVSVSVEDSSPNPVMRRALARLHSKRDAQMAQAVGSAVTGADGKYSIVVPEGAQYPLQVTLSKPYYNPASFSVAKTAGRISKDIILRNVSENEKEDLQKCGAPSGYGIGTKVYPISITAGVYFSADELITKVGMRITDISFMFYAKTVEEVSVFIDFGTERALARVVSNPRLGQITTVDVSDADIRIPEGAELCFGYSVKNCDDGQGYPLAIDGRQDDEAAAGGCVIGDGYMTPADSEDWGSAKFNLIVSAKVQGVSSPFAALGIKVIDNPGGWKAGDVFNFRFDGKSGEDPASTVWYLDGNAQTESSTVLTSGTHEVKALCTYADGSTEEIVQVISVE
ncbi:MAG: M6 family metalloprotease domain-containing protein [Bacteroidales bacterium]|nr:M6 family metalloprotease domain-containing protein [Bacteroidales bacterium]